MKFRDIVEVHSVDSRQKRQRNKDGTYNGQHFHDFVHPLTLHGEVQVDLSLQH